MIVYVTTRKHAYTLGIQLHYFPGKLATAVKLIPYESLYSLEELPAATYIFTDFDRLSEVERERAARLADYLVAGLVPVLNHPRRTLLRFDLLRRLHDVGVNDFNVYRLADWREVRRFPVFIRRELDHLGPLTPLIPDMAELSQAVERFDRLKPVGDLIVVEYANAPFADGRYRKYGLQRIGRQIFHPHCYITEDWLGKGIPSELGAADIREAMDVIRLNPNVDRLQSVFEIAKIDYGRMDYAMLQGRPQVFEINTNPTIISPPYERPASVDSSFFARQHEEAMMPVATAQGSGMPMPSDLTRGLRRTSVDRIHARTLAAVKRRMRLHGDRRRARRFLQQLFQSTAAPWAPREGGGAPDASAR